MNLSLSAPRGSDNVQEENEEESEEENGEDKSVEAESEESESEDWSATHQNKYVTFIYLFTFSRFIFYYASMNN